MGYYRAEYGIAKIFEPFVAVFYAFFYLVRSRFVAQRQLIKADVLRIKAQHVPQ
jgi:hypothetical protein